MCLIDYIYVDLIFREAEILPDYPAGLLTEAEILARLFLMNQDRADT